MPKNKAIISIKPKYASQILDKKKDIELRRIKTKFKPGMTLYIYSTSPESALVGSVKVKNVSWYSKDYIWKKYNGRTGTTRKEFLEYFKQSERGCVIELANPIRFSQVLALSQIKKNAPGFVPPQAYVFIDTKSDITKVINSHIGKCKTTKK